MKTITILDSMKSGYFMLVVCATLLFGASACSNEEFGVETPKVKKEWTKQELIEQARNRAIRTRVTSPFPITMTTINKTVTFKCFALKPMTIDWGDGTSSQLNRENTHTYTDGMLSHYISISGPELRIINLEVNDNGLISLDIDIPMLRYLDCSNNYLDSVSINSYSNLNTLNITNNEMLTLPANLSLAALRANNNRLKKIDVSKSIELNTLELKGNKITDLDLTNNTYLSYIILGNQSIATINNLPISDTSFSIFPYLIDLDISNLPFHSLDLSKNPKLKNLDISGTDISQLDISYSKIESLKASYSQLTNLYYHRDSIINLCDLRIERTPFEKEPLNIRNLNATLPDRSKPNQYGDTIQGVLYTHTQLIDKLKDLLNKNWVINP